MSDFNFLSAANIQVTGARLSRPIVNVANFDVKQPELMCLLGPNGAGKSTLLRYLTRTQNTKGAPFTVLGKPLDQWSERLLACRRGVLMQHNTLNFDLTVWDVVQLARYPHATGSVADEAFCTRALDMLDVLALRDRSMLTLSGGEQQRVHIARALCQILDSEMSQPKLLLLDEPCTGLDVAHQHGLMDTLRQLSQQNVAVICVLHDFNLAAQYADRVCVLDSGQVLLDAKPKHVFSSPLFSQLFHVELELITQGDTISVVTRLAKDD